MVGPARWLLVDGDENYAEKEDEAQYQWMWISSQKTPCCRQAGGMVWMTRMSCPDWLRGCGLMVGEPPQQWQALPQDFD